jgi:hypothetical protein
MSINNKIIALSLIVSTQLALFGAVLPEEKGTVSGLVRLGVINQKNVASTDTYATAIGGILKYETPIWNDLKLGVAGYGSQKLHFATGSWNDEKTNQDMLSEDGSSFAYVGEAYADYTANDLNIRVGRQLIDTPLVNTDEIRMLPDSYEAALVNYSGVDKTTFTAGYIKRWAGYDSGADISKFKKPAEGSHGVTMIGFTNESIDRLSLQGWFYSIDKVTDVTYADALYKIVYCESESLDLSVQAAHFSENSDSMGTMTKMDGNVYGLSTNYALGMVTVGAAYNRTYNKDGKSVGLGLGGGSYYTSMEEWTISGMEDAKAYRGSIALDLSDAGAKGLTLISAFGVFKSAPTDQKVDEWDVVTTYAYNDALSADISYAMIKDRHHNAGSSASEAGYERFLARLQYRF